jgi:uncharacterized SAM-binding protein YcdF (DUF218 family)
MKRKRSLIPIAAAVLLVTVFFLLAGKLLVVNEPPALSDAIIILGGGDGERELLASTLYKQHYAPVIIVSNGGTRGHPSTAYALHEIEWLRGYGVPDSAIVPELEAQSTYGNAVYSEKMMLQHHFKSAIVVSSTYHMRRAQYIFNKMYAGSGIRLTYCAAPVIGYSPERWWASYAGRVFTFSEYEKLVGYFVLYGLLNHKEM